MKNTKEFIVKESDAIGKVNVVRKNNVKNIFILCIIVIILFFIFGKDFRRDVPPEMQHPPISQETP